MVACIEIFSILLILNPFRHLVLSLILTINLIHNYITLSFLAFWLQNKDEISRFMEVLEGGGYN